VKRDGVQEMCRLPKLPIKGEKHRHKRLGLPRQFSLCASPPPIPEVDRKGDWEWDWSVCLEEAVPCSNRLITFFIPHHLDEEAMKVNPVRA
jgi:hypothetical protein